MIQDNCLLTALDPAQPARAKTPGTVFDLEQFPRFTLKRGIYGRELFTIVRLYIRVTAIQGFNPEKPGRMGRLP